MTVNELHVELPLKSLLKAEGVQNTAANKPGPVMMSEQTTCT